ncbi:hypothetical protein DQ04_10311010, partial [Trypanosoma grayi]|uniref:hypothetical protein n=1 Tax=Trypanosoma grayi TaxID=71804 RepID=UPI0004F3FA25
MASANKELQGLWCRRFVLARPCRESPAPNDESGARYSPSAGWTCAGLQKNVYMAVLFANSVNARGAVPYNAPAWGRRSGKPVSKTRFKKNFSSTGPPAFPRAGGGSRLSPALQGGEAGATVFFFLHRPKRRKFQGGISGPAAAKAPPVVGRASLGKSRSGRGAFAFASGAIRGERRAW